MVDVERLRVDIKALLKKYGIRKVVQKGIGGVFFKIISPLQRKYILRFCPVDEKKILFLSKPSFSDNSKAMYLHMVAEHPEYEYVWLIDDELELPADKKNVRFIRTKTPWHVGYPLKTAKEIMTSKYIYFTHNSPVENLPKRKEQFVVNLWHGCGYKGQIKREYAWNDKKKCDIALVPGKLFVQTKSECWGVGDDIIKPIGYPRYDLLKKESKAGRDYAEGLKGGSRLLIMWMPTFRKSLAGDYPEAHMGKEYDLPLLNSDDDLIRLNEICMQAGAVLCIKRHPSQMKYSCEDLGLSNIIFIDNGSLVKAGVELYEMLRYTDALISDYSSVSVDYLLLNKPIAFALDDYNQYKKARGFVFEDPLEYMPGHHLFEMSDMVNFIEDVCAGEDKFAEERRKMMPLMHNPCDNYCERIWITTVELARKKQAEGNTK